MTSNLEPYVVDTHALVWFLTNDKKLPAGVAEILQAAERGERQVIVPTIVLAEGIRIEERGRTGLAQGQILEWVLRHAGLVVVDFDVDIVIAMTKLDAMLELHDRIIAATARWLGFAVISLDSAIAAHTRTIWE